MHNDRTTIDRRGYAAFRATLILITLALFSSILSLSDTATADAAVEDTMLDVTDDDFVVSAQTFGAHREVVLSDDGQLVGDERSITMWFRMESGSCAEGIRVRVIDPQGSAQEVTPFSGCPAAPGLLEATFDAAYAGAGDWQVLFSNQASRGSRAGGYSVRAIRLDAVAAAEGSDEAVDLYTEHDVDQSHPAVEMAATLSDSFADVEPAVAIAPSGSQEPGEGYVYRYKTVTEAGGSERGAFAEGIAGTAAEGDRTVDVTVVRTDAVVEIVLLERESATGSETLSFDVVSSATRSWSRSASNFDNFEPGVDVDDVPASGVTVTDHGDLPSLIIQRNSQGAITNVVRDADADPVGVEFVESVVNSFHFTVEPGESSFSTTETSRLFQSREITSDVRALPGRDGVQITRVENVPAADLLAGESRQRDQRVLIANDGVVAASRSIDRTTIASSPDLADMDDNQNEALGEAKAAAITDLLFQGVFTAPVSFLTERLNYMNSAGTMIDTLDPATARGQRAQVRAIRDLELMDEALADFAAAPTASATVWRLADAIEAHPNRSGEVAQLVSSAATHDGALIAVSALVVAGRDVPQAQAALAGIMNDASVPIGRRLTAAVNSVAIGDPSAELVSAAQALAVDPEGAQNASSTLAWSALASRSKNAADDAAVYAHLSSAAAAATTTDDASLAVAALENLGDQASLALAYETAQTHNVYSSVTEIPAAPSAKLLTVDAECGHRDVVPSSGYVPGIDWGCSLGTKRVRAVLDIEMGVTGMQGGAAGGGSFRAEGSLGVNLYERDDNPDDDMAPEVRRNFEIARAVVTSELDRYDEKPLNDYVINVPGSEDVQFGQVEREFRFQVRTIFNSNDQSSENYWLVNKSAKVTCGLGAAFDLSLREDGEPRIATNWDPWELPISVGPFVIEISLHLRGSITFPTQVSLDICNFGLFDSAYYPRAWEQNELGVDPVDGVVWATLSATVTPTIKLDATVSVAVELAIVKVGVEAEGTLIGLELPIRGSLQLLDVNSGNRPIDFSPDADPIIDQVQAWGAPQLRAQPCWSVSAHLYLLRMRFKAFGEFGVRIPPVPPLIKGGWVTFYRQEWNLGSWEWQPNVSNWPFLQNLLDGLPILESDCSTIAPMVPIVTPITQTPAGSFAQPKVGGRRIGLFTGNYESAPDTVLYPSAEQFCIENDFPGYTAMASTANTESGTVLWNGASSAWGDQSPNAAGDFGRMIETLQCDVSATTTPGSGAIGMCLSNDPLDWTLLYTGPYGGYVTTSSDGGEFTPFLTSQAASDWTPGDNTQRMLQLAWYRVCVNDEGTVVTANSQAPLDKDTIFEYLTPWISGPTAYQDCTDLQVVLNLYELIDCDRFDPESFPDITVAVRIDDDGDASLLTSANESPGPTIASGEVDILFDVSNTGAFSMGDIAITGSGDAPTTCDVGDLEPTGTTTCTATLSTAVMVDGDPVEIAGTQARSITITGTYLRDGDTRDATFTQSFFFTAEADSSASFDMQVSLVGAGGSYDVSEGVDVVPGTYDLYPSITNTGQTNLELASVSMTGDWSDPGGCSGSTIEPGRTVSCTSQSVSVQADTDYSGSVEVNAGGITDGQTFVFSGGSAVTETPLQSGDVTITAYMKLSGDDTEHDATTTGSAPVMDPLLAESSEANILSFRLTNMTADVVYVDAGAVEFESGAGALTPLLFGCEGIEVPLGATNASGWVIDPSGWLDCVAQVRPSTPGAELLSTFTVQVTASENMTPLTLTSQNWLKTGVAQLGVANVTTNTDADQLAVSVANVSNYQGSLGAISATISGPGINGEAGLACPTTELATGDDMACSYSLLALPTGGTYTLTASADGVVDAVTTWTFTAAPQGTGSIGYPADGSAIDVGENLRYSGLRQQSTPTEKTGTGTFFTGGILPAVDFDLEIGSGTAVEYEDDGTNWWAEVRPDPGATQVTISLTEDLLLDAGGPLTHEHVIDVTLPSASDFIVDADVLNLPEAGVTVINPPASLSSDDETPVWLTLAGQNASIEMVDRILVAPHGYSDLGHGIVHRVVEQNGLAVRIVPVSLEAAIAQAVVDVDFAAVEAGSEHDFDLQANAATSEETAVCESSPIVVDYDNPEANTCEVSPSCDPVSTSCHVYEGTGAAGSVSEPVFIDQVTDEMPAPDDQWFDAQLEPPTIEVPPVGQQAEVNFSFRNAGVGGELDANWDLDHEFKLDIGPWFSNSPLRLNEFAAGFSVEGEINARVWAELALEVESQPKKPIFNLERAFMVGIVPVTVAGSATPFYNANLNGRIDAAATITVQGAARMEWNGEEGDGSWVETPAQATFDIAVEDVSLVATIDGDLTVGTEFGLKIMIADAVGAGIDFEPQFKFSTGAEASGTVDQTAQDMADLDSWAFEDSSFWKVERSFAIQPKLIVQVPLFDTPLGEAGSSYNSGILGQLSGGMAVDAALLAAEFATHQHDVTDELALTYGIANALKIVAKCMALVQLAANAPQTSGITSPLAPNGQHWCRAVPIYMPGYELQSAAYLRMAAIYANPGWVVQARVRGGSGDEDTTDNVHGREHSRSWLSTTNAVGGSVSLPTNARLLATLTGLPGAGVAQPGSDLTWIGGCWSPRPTTEFSVVGPDPTAPLEETLPAQCDEFPNASMASGGDRSGSPAAGFDHGNTRAIATLLSRRHNGAEGNELKNFYATGSLYGIGGCNIQQANGVPIQTAMGPQPMQDLEEDWRPSTETLFLVVPIIEFAHGVDGNPTSEAWSTWRTDWVCNLN